MMAPLRGASWVPPGLARLLAVALQGTILPWMATLVLPEGGLLPALPVQPVLFPPPNPPPGGDIGHITGLAPFAPWRPRPTLLSRTDSGPRTRIVTGPHRHWLHIWGN